MGEPDPSYYGGNQRGYVFFHLMNEDERPAFTLKSDMNESGFAGPHKSSISWSNYGAAIANIGDHDGDDVNDIVVGAAHEGYASFGEGGLGTDGGQRDNMGMIYVIHLKSSGEGNIALKDGYRIDWRNDNMPDYTDGEKNTSAGSAITKGHFGEAIENIGDVNGDGREDLAVGSPLWDNPCTPDALSASIDSSDDCNEGGLFLLFWNGVTAVSYTHLTLPTIYSV